MRACAHVTLRAFAGIGQHHHPGFGFAGSLQYAVEIGVETARNHQNRGAKFVQGHKHLLLGLRLRHDAHFILDRQNFGDACPEDGLIVGQNQFQHLLSSSPLVANEIVGVNHAGHAARLRGTTVGFVGTHYTTPALDDYTFFGSGHLRR